MSCACIRTFKASRGVANIHGMQLLDLHTNKRSQQGPDSRSQYFDHRRILHDDVKPGPYIVYYCIVWNTYDDLQ